MFLLDVGEICRYFKRAIQTREYEKAIHACCKPNLSADKMSTQDSVAESVEWRNTLVSFFKQGDGQDFSAKNNQFSVFVVKIRL
jgi:hypothetical protein